MAAINWTLTRLATGETKPIAQWGISSAIRRLVNQGEDSVELVFSGADLYMGRLFAVGERLVLKADSTTWFAGIVKPQHYTGNGSSESMSVTIAGPWYELQRIVYQQARKFVTDSKFVPAVPHSSLVDGKYVTLTDEQIAANNAVLGNIENYPTTTQLSPVIVSGQDSSGNAISSTAFLQTVLSYAASKGAALQVGTLPEGLDIPRETLRNVSCADLVTKQLRWTPDVTVWWDYSTTPATMNFIKHSAKPTATFSSELHNLTKGELNPADDLLIPGVAVCWIKRTARNDFEFYTQTVDQAGNPSLPGALVVAMELQGGKLVSSDGTLYSDGEPVPAGVAARIYEAFSQLYYRGTLTFKNQDCQIASLLPTGLNLSGLNPAWATMRASVQAQTDNTATGETLLELGAPPLLGPEELLELLRVTRNLTPVTDGLAKAAAQGGGSGILGSGYTPSTPRIPTFSTRTGPAPAGGQSKTLSTYSLRQWNGSGTVYGQTFDSQPASNYIPSLLAVSPGVTEGAATGSGFLYAHNARSHVSGPNPYQAYTSGSITYRAGYLDLRSYPTGKYAKILLSGVQRVWNSDSDGDYIESPVTVDVTALAGSQSWFSPPAPPSTVYTMATGFWYGNGQGYRAEVLLSDLLVYSA